MASSSPSVYTSSSEENANEAMRYRDMNITNMCSADSSPVRPINNSALLYDILHRIKCDSPLYLASMARQSGTANIIGISSKGISNSTSDLSGDNCSGIRLGAGNVILGGRESETGNSQKSAISHQSTG